MKKAIVMEINNGKAVVMTRDGAFETIPLRLYSDLAIGQEITLIDQKQSRVFPKPIMYGLTAAALFLIMTFSFFAYQAENMVAAYISIDINPSLEVGVNKQNEVIEVNPLNTDAERILSEIGDFKGEVLDNFIGDVMEVSQKAGYLEENRDVLIAATPINPDIKEKVTHSIEKSIANVQKEKSNVQISAIEVDEKQRDEAKKQGISTGKYMVYLESKKQHKDISIEEIKKSSISTLKKKLEKWPERPNIDKKNKLKENGNSKNKLQKGKKEIPKGLEKKNKITPGNPSQDKKENKKNEEKKNIENTNKKSNDVRKEPKSVNGNINNGNNKGNENNQNNSKKAKNEKNEKNKGNEKNKQDSNKDKQNNKKQENQENQGNQQNKNGK